ncbi:hypothetical protein [Streptomyces sp. NBC_00162]|uniref:hypothetical protein n=1 Tax=Streptomyces sp. NBC_00162 TaxID=2903629 RepID=UPI00214AE1D6|nr:hypothetical protein [Streptomyces sp. NBC_00162]UUU44108.1 hypothetical protein JIW86_38215 [Streptomyces sp. NBC_00162]
MVKEDGLRTAPAVVVVLRLHRIQLHQSYEDGRRRLGTPRPRDDGAVSLRKDEGPGGTPLTEQVLAWLITSQGRATAITVDAQRHFEDADGADAFIPPGEDPVA